MAITKVDLRGLEPGLPAWQEAQAAVTASMVAHGCVLVTYDAISPEQRRLLFSRAMPELFALPLETKQRNVSAQGQFRGYIAHKESNYESVAVDEPPMDEGNIHGFTSLFWPQGNPEFCDTLLPFAKNLLKLEQTVQKMTLEGLGVREENISSHLSSLTHTLRLGHYGGLPDTDSVLSMRVHRDFNMSTVVVQHEVEGLQVLDKDGSWVAVPPEPDTFAIQAGELFTAVTNGRVPACVHRVRAPSNRERFSMVFGSWSRDGGVVSAMDDLVDGEHPLMYNPCMPDEYIEFLFDKQGGGHKLDLDDPLKAFCGVDKKGGSTESSGSGRSTQGFLWT